jgi:phosphate transport system substrate-binding protein
MKKTLLSSLLAACILLSACSTTQPVEKPVTSSQPPTSETRATTPPETTKPQPSASFTKETYPRIDGSTATIPLSEAMASKLLGLSNEEATKFIKHNQTHGAYVNLIEGKADIIFVTEPSKEELDLAKTSNIELEVIPVVKEGFVFLVNTKNPVDSLTVKQVQDIYQGKIKNWKEVGGENKEILAYQRDPNSGSQTLMEQLVMKGISMADMPKKIVSGMEGLIDTVAKYDNSGTALGYSVFYYAKTMYNRDTIKLLKIDNAAPDNKNISSGKYPFTTAYYAVLKKTTPEDSSARKLLKWVLSMEGQKVAEEAGYVPLEVK